jgi:hypothetical protein
MQKRQISESNVRASAAACAQLHPPTVFAFRSMQDRVSGNRSDALRTGNWPKHLRCAMRLRQARLQIDYGFASTASENAAHYQYVIIPTLLYANVSLYRLAFSFARAVTVAVVICLAAVVLSVNYIAGPVAVMILVQLAICAYTTLVANYTMERDLRRLRDLIASSIISFSPHGERR